jgi:hypothetical protein
MLVERQTTRRKAIRWYVELLRLQSNFFLLLSSLPPSLGPSGSHLVLQGNGLSEHWIPAAGERGWPSPGGPLAFLPGIKGHKVGDGAEGWREALGEDMILYIYICIYIYIYVRI